MKRFALVVALMVLACTPDVPEPEPETPGPSVPELTCHGAQCSIGWSTFEGPGFEPQVLVAVSETQLWAVAWEQASFFDGQAWQTPTQYPKRFSVDAARASSASDLTLVGRNLASPYYQPVAMQWNGQGWTDLQPPGTQGQPLYEVWGVSSSDFWAAGHERFLRWNGSEWTSATLPFSTTRFQVLSLHGSAANNVWAIGSRSDTASSFVLRFNGTAWEDQTPPTEAGLSSAFGAWTSSPSNAWLVGWDSNEKGYARHWNGQQWRTYRTDAPLNAVWGTSASDVWFLGGNSEGSGKVYHWDGAELIEVTLPTTQLLYAGTSASPKRIWFRGLNGVLVKYER